MRKRLRDILTSANRKNGVFVLIVVAIAAVGVGVLTERALRVLHVDEAVGNDHDDVPAVVRQDVEKYVENLYLDSRQSEDNYIDWRVDSLIHSYTYEDFNGMVLQVYRFNYEFLSSAPEEVQLLGGMSIDEDGWVVTTYPNSHYFVYQQEGDSLTYLRYMFENDCFPGDETFTNDLWQIYDMGELVEARR